MSSIRVTRKSGNKKTTQNIAEKSTKAAPTPAPKKSREPAKKKAFKKQK